METADTGRNHALGLCCTAATALALWSLFELCSSRYVDYLPAVLIWALPIWIAQGATAVMPRRTGPELPLLAGLLWCGGLTAAWVGLKLLGNPLAIAYAGMKYDRTLPLFSPFLAAPALLISAGIATRRAARSRTNGRSRMLALVIAVIGLAAPPLGVAAQNWWLIGVLTESTALIRSPVSELREAGARRLRAWRPFLEPSAITDAFAAARTGAGTAAQTALRELALELTGEPIDESR
jgi:hypothetical protein